MFKILSTLAAVMLAVPAVAAPDVKTVSFTRNGIAYVATDSVVDGRRVLEGHEVESGRPFRLIVWQGRVSGTYDETLVSFPVPSKPLEVASR